MLQDSATVEASYQRFLKRVAESEIVIYLSNNEGVANSVSNDDEEATILMFWSDEAYAKRVENVLPEEFEVAQMSLFDFLYRWLPGMSGDGVLAGPNWDGNLFGKELDPFELREDLEEIMSKSLHEKYEQKYIELTEGT